MHSEGSSASSAAGGPRWWPRITAFVRGFWGALWEYTSRVLQKADDDNIFLLASGLTFSFLIAAVPFLAIIVALISLTLQAAAEASGLAPIDQLIQYLEILIPVLPESAPGGGTNLPRALIQGAIERGPTIGLISFVAFLWFSTRLFGTIRAVLREIFDLRQARGIVQGKLFDTEMVVVSSVLLILNIGVTILFNLGKARGFEFLGLSPSQVGVLNGFFAWITALAFIFLMFLLVYKYVPARRIPWRTAVTAALFTAVCWEILKLGFGFYLTRLASFRSVYGGIASTLVVVVIWVYYVSIVFVLGAEVAQVHELRRARRRQHELLD